MNNLQSDPRSSARLGFLAFNAVWTWTYFLCLYILFQNKLTPFHFHKPLKSVTNDQCNARPTVTFPAAGHHRPLTCTKLYCLVTEAHACEQLAQGCYLKARGRESNPRPSESPVQRPTTPLRQQDTWQQWLLKKIIHVNEIHRFVIEHL